MTKNSYTLNSEKAKQKKEKKIQFYVHYDDESLFPRLATTFLYKNTWFAQI